MKGNGVYKWPDGEKYECEYMNNIKEVKGIFKLNKGKIYDGNFKGGKPNGEGILKTKGREFNVTFKNCELFRKVNEITKNKIGKYKDNKILSSITNISEYDNDNDKNNNDKSNNEEKKENENENKNKKKLKNNFFVKNKNFTDDEEEIETKKN